MAKNRDKIVNPDTPSRGCHAPPGARNEESRSPINNFIFTDQLGEHGGRRKTNNIGHQTQEKLRFKNTEESHEENWNR